MVEFVFSMHPGGRYVFHDGMVGFSDGYLEGVPGAMTRSAVDTSDEGLVSKNFPFDTISKVGRTPSQPDHFIVGIPIAESVVCGMYEDKTSPFMNELNRRLFGFLSPFPPVVVENDRLMRTLEGIPILPAGCACWPHGCANGGAKA